MSNYGDDAAIADAADRERRENDPAKLKRERDEARVQLAQAKALVGPLREELGNLRRKNEQMRALLKNLRGVVIMKEHRAWIDKCLGR